MMAALLSLHQRSPTAKGFSFLTLEDETGIFNGVLTPDVYSRYRLDLSGNPMILIEGIVEKVSGVIHLKIVHLKSIPNLPI